MNEMVQVVERCARATAEERGVEMPADFSIETPLFGRHGVFDSMGLVSMIVAVEEAIADSFGVEIALADQRAMSQTKSPFLSCSSLAHYATQLISECH